MNLSSYQEAIISASKARIPFAACGVAGCGKTTTLELSARANPLRPLCLAFNKSIASEMDARGLNAKTFHSLGLAALAHFGKRPKVDFKKLDNLAAKLNLTHDFLAKKLVSVMKNGLLPVTSLRETEFFLDNVTDENAEQALIDTQMLFDASVSDTSCFDFDDMLYFPATGIVPLSSPLAILIDEAQDLNPVQHAFISRLNAKHIGIFGDPNQAIYGFRGADENSYNNLISMFSLTELPLSISYRVSLAAAELAKAFVPRLETHPSAKPGTVSFMDSPRDYPSSCMILSRRNIPLISEALRFLRMGRPFNMNSNFPGRLLATVRALRKFNGAAECVAYQYSKAEKLAGKRGFESEMEKAEAMELLASGCTTRKELMTSIERLSPKTEKAPTLLSTVHQAKGLEHENVFILRPDHFRIPEGQETNLAYVAVTRTKDSLTFIGPQAKETIEGWIS